MEVFSLFAAKVQACANTAMISRGKVQSFIVLFTAALDQAHPHSHVHVHDNVHGNVHGNVHHIYGHVGRVTATLTVNPVAAMDHAPRVETDHAMARVLHRHLHHSMAYSSVPVNEKIMYMGTL